MRLQPIHRVLLVLLSIGCLSLWPGSALPVSAQNAARPIFAASNAEDYTREADFGPDGQLVLDVNVADIAFHQGDSGKLKLVIHARNADRAELSSWVREWTVSHQHAKLELKLPSHNKDGDSPHIDVYVPEKTSVKLGVDVGNVEMSALAGNIELTIGVGNVNIDALDPSHYHEVEGSVSMGNISDEVFGMNPSGLFGKDASFHGSGPWKIKLQARIGNIEIHKVDKGKRNSSAL